MRPQFGGPPPCVGRRDCPSGPARVLSSVDLPSRIGVGVILPTDKVGALILADLPAHWRWRNCPAVREQGRRAQFGGPPPHIDVGAPVSGLATASMTRAAPAGTRWARSSWRTPLCAVSYALTSFCGAASPYPSFRLVTSAAGV